MPLFVISSLRPPSLNTEHIVNSNAIKPSEKTTQPALKSSAVPSTKQQPQYPTSSSSDVYTAHSTSHFQSSTPEELNTREQNPSPNGLPLQPTSVNCKTRRVPEKDDESLAEYPPDTSSEGGVARLDVVELERQLSAILTAQTERDQHLAEPTEELALKSSLLEQAEANATKAARRAGQESRELTDRLLAQTSLVEHKDAELVDMDMQAKLDELILSRDRAQSAWQMAISRAAVAEERSQRACEQYETELAEVRAELKAGKAELEAVRLRLTDAEIGWAKSKAEADTLRALTMAGLVSTDEDRMTHRLLERIRAMETEMASTRWSEKSLEAIETRNEG